MASGVALKETLTQVNHGFTPGQPIRYNGTQYVLAQADTAANAEALGVVESVANDDFTVVECGRAVIPGQSYIPGKIYFLSAQSPGVVQDTEPDGLGQISKPMFQATSAISCLVFQYRGVVIQ